MLIDITRKQLQIEQINDYIFHTALYILGALQRLQEHAAFRCKEYKWT